MNDGLGSLSGREKETLRLLLKGHDAKSIARDLGLSVHTVNERLRDVRRKLGVSSSREAARLLWQAEQSDPKIFGDKHIGVPSATPGFSNGERSDERRRGGYRPVWLGGGILVMSIIAVAFMLSSPFQAGMSADAPVLRTAAGAPVASQATEPAGARAARAWIALVDSQRWEESWTSAGALIKSRISQADFASTVRPVRQPLGAVTSRVFKSVTKATSLPGAPDGEYEIIQFGTSFANKADSIETVTLAREGSGWKVAGYFIR